jgi:hypothetical protein
LAPQAAPGDANPNPNPNLNPNPNPNRQRLEVQLESVTPTTFFVADGVARG